VNTRSPSTIRLTYASPTTNRPRHPASRLPTQSPWGALAAWSAAAALVCCVVCCAEVLTAAGQSAPELWAASSACSELGMLFAFIGCLQRTHRRSLSVQALSCNALLIVLPLIVILLLLPRC
jgi:hypothetical protein